MDSPNVGTSDLQLNLTFYGLDCPSQTLQLPTIQNTTSSMQQETVVLSSMATLTVPTNAGGFIYQPPVTNTYSVLLGFTSDGLYQFGLANQAPTMIPFSGSPPANIYLYPSQPTQNVTVQIFWL